MVCDVGGSGVVAGLGGKSANVFSGSGLEPSRSPLAPGPESPMRGRTSSEAPAGPARRPPFQRLKCLESCHEQTRWRLWGGHGNVYPYRNTGRTSDLLDLAVEDPEGLFVWRTAWR